MSALPQPGEMFGRYEVTERIGRGGMGVVFSARQVDLDRKVALKLLSPDLAESEEYRRRFGREAAALARLDSPHVITVHDAGEHDGWLYIVTQLVPDGDLSTRLKHDGPFPPATALDIIGQVAEGLADAHQAGILHRDIKPSNVLLARRANNRLTAYLCDFGIAMEEGSEHTKTSGVIGTLGYMAPERNLGEPASVASDVYALGCLLYALLAGAAPYQGSDFAVMTAHLNDPVPQVALPAELAWVNQLLAAMMAKRPEDRPSTIADVSAALAGRRVPEPVVDDPEATRIRPVAVAPDATLVRPVVPVAPVPAPTKPQAVPPPAPEARPKRQRRRKHLYDPALVEAVRRRFEESQEAP